MNNQQVSPYFINIQHQKPARLIEREVYLQQKKKQTSKSDKMILLSLLLEIYSQRSCSNTAFTIFQFYGFY